MSPTLLTWLVLPSVVLPVAVGVLWPGDARLRRVGRILAGAVAVAAGLYALLAILAVLVGMGTAMRSFGNFQAFVGLVLFAVVHVVAFLIASRAARRGSVTAGSMAVALAALVIGVMASAVLADSLHRSRGRANEAGAIGDIRSFIHAQRAYADGNGGFFDVPACLTDVARCRPAGPRDVAPFLVKEELAEVRNGYRRSFHAGPPPSPADIERLGASPTSLIAYAYVAVPDLPGQIGSRAFCGSSDGTICMRLDGTMPAPIDGRCPENCSRLDLD